jgi:hypothetical protein
VIGIGALGGVTNVNGANGSLSLIQGTGIGIATDTGSGNITITNTGTSGGGTSIANGTIPDRGEVAVDGTGNITYTNSGAVNGNQSFSVGNNFQVIAGSLVSLAGNSVELSDVGAGINMIPSTAGGLNITQPSGGSLIMSGSGAIVSLLSGSGGGLTIPSSTQPITLSGATGQNMTLSANTAGNAQISQLKVGTNDNLGITILSGSTQTEIQSQTLVDIKAPLITLGALSGTTPADIQLNGTVTVNGNPIAGGVPYPMSNPNGGADQNQWVSGQAYIIGSVVYSPTAPYNWFLCYVAVPTGTNTDPQDDINAGSYGQGTYWQLLAPAGFTTTSGSTPGTYYGPLTLAGSAITSSDLTTGVVTIGQGTPTQLVGVTGTSLSLDNTGSILTSMPSNTAGLENSIILDTRRPLGTPASAYAGAIVLRTDGNTTGAQLGLDAGGNIFTGQLFVSGGGNVGGIKLLGGQNSNVKIGQTDGAVINIDATQAISLTTGGTAGEVSVNAGGNTFIVTTDSGDTFANVPTITAKVGGAQMLVVDTYVPATMATAGFVISSVGVWFNGTSLI